MKNTYIYNVCIRMKNAETSIVFAFPVHYSRISAIGFVHELCLTLEVKSELQVVSTKETYIYLSKIFKYRERKI